jgi:molecular chaperone GrpE
MRDEAAGGLPDKFLDAFDFAAELEGRARLHEEEMRRLLTALLEVADSFDRLEEAFGPAGRPTPEQAAQWRQTFFRVGKQLQVVLRAASVTPVACLGEPADPHRHEVVGVKDVPGTPEGVIVEETIRGYLWGGRVLRLPRVVTAAPPTRSDSCSQ